MSRRAGRRRETSSKARVDKARQETQLVYKYYYVTEIYHTSYPTITYLIDQKMCIECKYFISGRHATLSELKLVNENGSKTNVKLFISRQSRLASSIFLTKSIAIATYLFKSR